VLSAQHSIPSFLQLQHGDHRLGSGLSGRVLVVLDMGKPLSVYLSSSSSSSSSSSNSVILVSQAFA
jgi:hypothetical protein